MMFKRPGSGTAGVTAKRAPQFNAAHVALLGLGLAGAGVIGDAIARAAGVVASEGAMQPPFDFLLFTGAGLLLAIALRSAAAQIDGFGKRVALPALVGIGGAAAVVFAFGGPAATKSVDKVVRTIAAQPSVVQSAPRTAGAVRHARHTAVRTHHRAAAGTHAHHARSASHGHAAKSVSVSAAATTHHQASSHHAARTVVVHRRATRHASAAPHRRSAARPAPHRTQAKSKGRFQQVATPNAPSAAPTPSASAPSSSTGSSSSAPAATSPAASPTATPTPTTSNPPASANPPATPPTAAKHGGQGQG